MATNITPKDIEYLDSVIATETYSRNVKGYVVKGETGKARHSRLIVLGLIELCEIEGQAARLWKPTAKGQELIAPMQAERQRKQSEREAESLKFAQKRDAIDEAFKSELRAAGVTLFIRARVDSVVFGGEHSVDFPITCRIEYSRSDKRYFVRVAVGHSGESDPDALIEEARQAKIARDMLNAKLAENKGE